MTATKLNGSQIKAIKHGTGPLLIIAGAGTGKTTVITERVKHLITKRLVKPEEILALTFTEKAASEMEERVDLIMPLSYGDLWISTFHSFCDRVLREKAVDIGLSPSYKLMTAAQAIDLVRKNLFDFDLDYFRPLGNPNKFIDGMLRHFSRLQDELVSSDDYLNFAKAFKHKEALEVKKLKELANAYKFYTQLKIKNDFMDFSDLITYTVKLFKERPNVLSQYQEKFKYILVDEYQDTNYAQNELVNLLASKNKNITVVGDDNQSIYRFRGAAISNILQFKKKYKNCEIVTLSENYRSTQAVLDAAYTLIKHNDPDTLEAKLGISKKLISKTKSKNEKIEFIHTKKSSDEVEEVVDEIIKLTKSKYDYKDIAILVRANNHSQEFIREFERRGIPHQFLGPEKLFERPEIVDLISYLKVLYNPEDSESFYRLISSDFLEIDPFYLIKIASQAKRESKSLFEVFAVNKENKKLVDLINKHLRSINKSTAGEVLFDFIKEMGLMERLVKAEDTLAAQNIAKFFEKVKAFEDENKNPNIYSVVDYIDLLTEVGEGPSVTDGDWQENNAVNILTTHSAKGLEFPVVFMVNLVSERFPSRAREEQIPIPLDLIKEELPEGDFHLQEERRLFYVGMTRAKEKLYFTAADFYGDGKRAKKISPFVFEALGQLDIKKQSKEDKIKLPNYQKQEEITASTRPFRVDYLSVSQIETFKTCPMHYKLRYIYKLPTPPSASISFGVSIHESLKDFYKDGGDILKIFKKNFIEDGYENKKHKDKFFEKGGDYLKGFLNLGYDKKINTIDLEKKFVFKISPDLKIGGTIDRLDDLGNGMFEVVDYKTGGNIPTQKEVDKNLQLSVYAMAVSELYKVKPENIKLSLYYLDNQEKLTTSKTAKDLEKVKKEILEVREEIQNSDFKCNNNFFCQGKCEFSMFCK